MSDHVRAETLFFALARAEAAVSRLDERVRGCGFGAGFLARLDFLEASAWGWRTGEIVSLEDLLLHDEDMDARAPDQALRAAHEVVRARRKAAVGGPELLSRGGVAWLTGRRAKPPSPPSPSVAIVATAVKTGADEEGQGQVAPLLAALAGLSRGVTEDAGAAVDEWLELLGRESGAPALLRAAVALEAWRIIDPLPRASYVGPVLVAIWLREQGRTPAHPLSLECGWRALIRRANTSRFAPMADRLAFWLEAMVQGAELATAEIQRLELARQVVAARIATRRAGSGYGPVLEMLLHRPVVTAGLVAARLKIAPQSARRLVQGLGASVKEVSGRSRFRAWRL